MRGVAALRESSGWRAEVLVRDAVLPWHVFGMVCCFDMTHAAMAAAVSRLRYGIGQLLQEGPQQLLCAMAAVCV